MAFISFLLFASFQLVVAIIAKSEAMIGDCTAMAVDGLTAVTYGFNLVAERKKHDLDDDDHHYYS